MVPHRDGTRAPFPLSLALDDHPSVGPLDLHVTLRWRDDILAFRRLRGDGAAAIGAHPAALAPTPCAPAHPDGFVFARLDRGAATAFAPDGGVVSVQRADGRVDLVEGPTTVTLGDGDTAELAFGGFRWAASADVPVPTPPRRRRRVAGIWGAIAVGGAGSRAGARPRRAGGAGVEPRRARRRRHRRRCADCSPPPSCGPAPTIRRSRTAPAPARGRLANDARGDGRLGGGARALGEEGRMGDRLGRAADARRYAVAELTRKDPDPSAARAEAPHRRRAVRHDRAARAGARGAQRALRRPVGPRRRRDRRQRRAVGAQRRRVRRCVGARPDRHRRGRRWARGGHRPGERRHARPQRRPPRSGHRRRGLADGGRGRISAHRHRRGGGGIGEGIGLGRTRHHRPRHPRPPDEPHRSPPQAPLLRPRVRRLPAGSRPR